MLSGGPLRYRSCNGFSQASAPAPSMAITTAVNTIVVTCRFVKCSCHIRAFRHRLLRYREARGDGQGAILRDRQTSQNRPPADREGLLSPVHDAVLVRDLE